MFWGQSASFGNKLKDIFGDGKTGRCREHFEISLHKRRSCLKMVSVWCHSRYLTVSFKILKTNKQTNSMP